MHVRIEQLQVFRLEDKAHSLFLTRRQRDPLESTQLFYGRRDGSKAFADVELRRFNAAAAAGICDVHADLCATAVVDLGGMYTEVAVLKIRVAEPDIGRRPGGVNGADKLLLHAGQVQAGNVVSFAIGGRRQVGDGITIDYLSPFNEPGIYTKISADKISDFLKNNLGPIFFNTEP